MDSSKHKSKKGRQVEEQKARESGMGRNGKKRMERSIVQALRGYSKRKKEEQAGGKRYWKGLMEVCRRKYLLRKKQGKGAGGKRGRTESIMKVSIMAEQMQTKEVDVQNRRKDASRRKEGKREKRRRTKGLKKVSIMAEQMRTRDIRV